jgi:hypothetical protein
MNAPTPFPTSITTALVRTAPGAGITATARYKDADTSHSATADEGGYAAIPFTISRPEPGYRVVVQVTAVLPGRTATCSTSFTPR